MPRGSVDLTIIHKRFERMAHQQYQYSRFDTVLRQCYQGNVNVLQLETTFVDGEEDITSRQRDAQGSGTQRGSLKGSIQILTLNAEPVEINRTW